MQDGRKLIAWLEQQGYFEDARKECEILLVKEPENTELRALHASLLARCGRPEEAIVVYSDIAMEWAEKGQYLRAISCSKAIALLDFSAYEQLSRRLAAFYNQRYAMPGATGEPLPFSEITASIPVSVLGSEALLGEQDSSGEMPISWVQPPANASPQGAVDASAEDGDLQREVDLDATLNTPPPRAKTSSTNPLIFSPFEPMQKAKGTSTSSSPSLPKKRRTGEIDQVALEEFREREAAHKEPQQRLPSLFSRLDADSTAALMDYLFPVEAPAGKVLMQQGEYGNEFFLISEGRVVLTRRVDGEEEVLAELGPGQFFGEIALLTPLRRTATVTCLETCQLLRLTREDLRNVVQFHPNVDTELRRFVYQRLIQNLLLTSLLFFALSSEDRVSFVEFFSVLEAKEGVFLLHEDQPSDALYLIAGGTAELLKRKGPQEEVSFQHLGVGDFFGESAILGRDNALYSVRLAEDSVLLKLRTDEATRIRPRFPKAIEIVRNISEQRRREILALSSVWAM